MAETLLVAAAVTGPTLVVPETEAELVSAPAIFAVKKVLMMTFVPGISGPRLFHVRVPAGAVLSGGMVALTNWSLLDGKVSVSITLVTVMEPGFTTWMLNCTVFPSSTVPLAGLTSRLNRLSNRLGSGRQPDNGGVAGRVGGVKRVGEGGGQAAPPGALSTPLPGADSVRVRGDAAGEHAGVGPGFAEHDGLAVAARGGDDDRYGFNRRRVLVHVACPAPERKPFHWSRNCWLGFQCC